MEAIDAYIEKLFNDPGFGIILGIVSIWYSYYLFKRPQKNNRILFITSSNYRKFIPRTTRIVLINQGKNDILKSAVFNPITICINQNILVSNFEIKYNSFPEGNFKLIRKSSNCFIIDFDILKTGQELILMLTHDSKRHMDETWKDIDVNGIIIDFEIHRDDFSDQMIRRARSIELEAAVGTFFASVVFAFTVKTLLKPFQTHLPYTYLFASCFFVGYFLLYNHFASRVGHNEYLAYWKVAKKHKKVTNKK